MAWVVAHHGLPVFLGDGMDAYPQAFREFHGMLGFVSPSLFFCFWASHEESPGRDAGKAHADAIGPVGAYRLDAVRQQFTQACFQGRPLRRVEFLGQHVQQAQQFSPRIALLLQPIREDQTDADVRRVIANRGQKGVFGIHSGAPFGCVRSAIRFSRQVEPKPEKVRQSLGQRIVARRTGSLPVPTRGNPTPTMRSFRSVWKH